MWNYPPSQILVPVDFGDASRRAAQVAEALASTFASHVRLLHVENIEAPAYFTHQQVALIEGERETSRQVAERHLAGFVSLSVPFSVQVVQAPPAAAILDNSHSADLIVMGTHGRRGPSRWWLGSVAERVSRSAQIPVLVVRAAAADAQPPGDVFRHPMMVAGSQVLDGAAARYARGLAESFGGQVKAQVAACEADLARESDASLVVVAKPQGDPVLFGDSVERMLRLCKLPMLFVPA